MLSYFESSSFCKFGCTSSSVRGKRVKELGFVPMGIDNVDRWVGGVVVSRKG